MFVKDSMKAPVWIEATETLEVAALRLKEADVGCLPVCEGDRVLGVLTDRDVLVRGVAERRELGKVTTRQAMSADALYCFEDDPADEAFALLKAHGLRRMPVLGRDQRLVGIISLSDMTGEGSARAPFEVSFYEERTNSYGYPQKVELMRVAVAPGHTREEAVAAAIEVFEQEKQAQWSAVAAGFAVRDLRQDERVRRRAYEIWEREGRPTGRSDVHWMQAEREVQAEGGSEEDGAAA